MANDATDVVMCPSSFELDGGGATAIRRDRIAHGAWAVVATAHFIHGVSTSIVELCLKQKETEK